MSVISADRLRVTLSRRVQVLRVEMERSDWQLHSCSRRSPVQEASEEMSCKHSQPSQWKSSRRAGRGHRLTREKQKRNARDWRCLQADKAEMSTNLCRPQRTKWLSRGHAPRADTSEMSVKKFRWTLCNRVQAPRGEIVLTRWHSLSVRLRNPVHLLSGERSSTSLQNPRVNSWRVVQSESGDNSLTEVQSLLEAPSPPTSRDWREERLSKPFKSTHPLYSVTEKLVKWGQAASGERLSRLVDSSLG
jgi:hypothetical protein